MQITVTIDNTKVAADLTDFVVYIDLSDMPADFWSTVTNGGGDIRVYKSDGTTELAREVVSCDTATDTGELHIKYSGTLSGSVDTEIIIDVDGARTEPAVTATYGRNAVWSDYAAVWHMDGTTDSTGNGHTLSAQGSVSAGGATGKVGKATTFDGINDYFTVADANALDPLSGDWTVSAWANTNDHTKRTSVLWKGTNAGDWWALTFEGASFTDDNGFLMDDATDFDFARGGGATTADNTWYHLVGQYDNTGDDMYLFRDGSQIGSFLNASMGDINSVESLQIGYESANLDATAGYFNGEIDEVRLRASYLSSDWNATEYENQNSPSTFYSVAAGGITITPAAQVVTASLPARSVVTGSTITPSAQLATLNIPTYSVTIAALVTPAAQVATFSIPVYVLDAGGNITVAVQPQVLSASIPTYSVIFDKLVSANALVATFSTPAPTLSGGSGATITPAAQVATLSIPTYTVATAFSLIVSAATQVLTFSLPTLAKVGGVWTKRARETSATWSRRSVNDD